ncbi:MAG: DNA translocase FtsK [Chloroflexi bacterium]|nr:DNA translocase FtsK [Chloroflexota bacterium]
MATSRKAAALPARATRPEHWDIAGFGGFIVAAFGVLSFVGLIVDDALVVTGAAATVAAGVGRAAPLGSLAGALIGGAVLIAGARRRAIIDVTHFVAAAVFVAALASMTDLAAVVANQGQPEGGGAIGGLIGSAMRAGIGDTPAFLVLAVAAVLALAYGLVASPLGAEAVMRPGRFVIQTTRFLGSGLLRVIAAANARARPWFSRTDRAEATPTDVGVQEAEEDDSGEDQADDGPAWGQQPLIRVADRMPAAAATPQPDGRWQLPGVDMLLPAEDSGEVPEDEIVSKAASIEETLESFKVQVRVAEAVPGPVVTQYLLEPGPGVKVSRITALANDLALKLAARSVRIEAPVPGQPFVGLETPNDNPAVVTLREVMESQAWAASDADIKVALGQDVAGNVRVADLAKMPHVLIAGATGAGKSVCLTSLITGIMFTRTPDEMQLVLIDPKMVELVAFEGIPHLRMPVVTDVNEVVDVLTWVSNEMARRYRTFSKAGVRNLASYNASPPEDSDGPLPYIVVVIDELADLMMTAPGDVERLLARLAQMARATGIHLVISTQRPSVDVITGLIKANFPTRISFMVSSQADSRTVLDAAGAERLIGRGDMLYAPPEGGKAQRIQGVRVTDEEVRAAVQHWRDQGEPNQVPRQELQQSEEDEEDEIFVEATELVMRHESITPDQLARELGIGRSLALKLGHRLEEEGFVGPPLPQSLRRPVLQRQAAD